MKNGFGEQHTARIREVEARLEELAGERNRLVGELASLRAASPMLEELPAVLGTPGSARAPQSSEEKVALFLKLFRARESVFPKLWENKVKKTKGYSPACNNEWAPNVCRKPQVKCNGVRLAREIEKNLAKILM